MEDFIGKVLCRKRMIIVVTGHYGSGKSCFSVNLALKLKEALNEKGNNASVTLCDLDIVNPYFRSADSAGILSSNGVRVIVQEFANSNVDIPSIPGEVNSIFDTEGYSVLDIGGDDSGAMVLGGMSDKIKDYGFMHLCVVNFKRPLSETPEDALSYIREIEKASRLPVTGIVNNTNLGSLTTKEIFTSSFDKAERLRALSSVPLLVHSYAGAFEDENIFIMKDYTKKYF